MKILITGGTGLISGPITRQLLDRGDSVTHYDKPSAATPAGVRRIDGDRYDARQFVEDMLAAGPFDCVLDMICYKPEDAEAMVRAFRGRAGHVIFCSTIDVYTKPASQYPVSENEPQKGIGEYARNKALCEKVVRAAAADGAFPLTILRPAATYGPGTFHRGNVVHTFGGGTTFLDRLRKGKPVIAHGDGSSIWVEGFHEDVGSGFVATVCNSKAFGNSYHLPGPDYMTWNQHYELLAGVIGAPKPQIVHMPTDLLAQAAPKSGRLALENFQFNNIFDSSAARRDLGFNPSVRTADGMRRTIDWIEATGGFDNCETTCPFYDRLLAAWEKLGPEMAAATAPHDSGMR